jgi:tetratricopeptide (TPR) repeat protein
MKPFSICTFLVAVFVYLAIIFFSPEKVEHLYPVSYSYPLQYAGKYGYINQAGTPIIQPQYEYAGKFVEGLAAVKINRRWGFIDQAGKLIIPANFENDIQPVFSEDRAAVTLNGKSGFIDKKGNAIISLQFDEVRNFSKGIATARVGNKWGAIDSNGNWIIQPRSAFPISFFQGITLLDDITLWDKFGNFLGNDIFNINIAQEFHDGLAIIYQNSSNGLISLPTMENFSLLKLKCGFQDQSARIVVPPQFDDCQLFSQGLAAIKVGEKWGYINWAGRMVIQPQFDYADQFQEDRALIISQEKLGFIDRAGKEIVPPTSKMGFVSISELSGWPLNRSILEKYRFKNGLAALTKNNRCGYVDRKGVWVIEAKFLSCQPFDQYGVAEVHDDSAFEFDYVPQYLDNNLYIDRSGSKIARYNPKNTKELYVGSSLIKVKILSTIFISIAWILSISLHEFGHAIFAYWGGDHSVKAKGYLTLNPFRYIHPITSIFLPAITFIFGGIPLPGAAVYVVEENLRNRFWHSLMSFAGPMANGLLGLLLIPIVNFSLDHHWEDWISATLAFLLFLQFLMLGFNLLPIPPLDGYRIFYSWLPKSLQKYNISASLIGLIFLTAISIFPALPIWGIFLQPFVNIIVNVFKGDLKYILDLSLDGGTLYDRVYSMWILLLIVSVYSVFKPAKVLNASAFALESLKKYRSALVIYQKSAKLDSKDSWANSRLGFCLEKLNQYEEGLAAYQHAIEFDPKNAWVQGRIGWCLGELGRDEESLIAFECMADLEPKNAWPRRQIGWHLEQLDRYDEAIVAFQYAIDLEPKNAWVHRRVGWCLQQSELYEEALIAFKNAIDLDPKDLWTQNRISWCLEKIEHSEEASITFECAVELDLKE